MRTQRCVLLASLISSLALAQASDPPIGDPSLEPFVPKTAISADVAGWYFRFLNFEIERVTTPWMTFYVQPGFFDVEMKDAAGQPTGTLRGPGLNIGARFYVLGSMMKGVYLSPHVFGMAPWRENDYATIRLGGGGGLSVGATWLLFDRVYVAAGVGGAVKYGGYDPLNAAETDGLQWLFLPRASLGFAF
jgi:hypothetical protein